MMRQNITIVFFSKVHFEKNRKEELPVAEVKTKPYVLENGLGTFEGFHTNDAPLADTVHYLDSKGERLHRVYCLVTPECISEMEVREREDKRGLSLHGSDPGMIADEHGEKRRYRSQFEFWHTRMKRLLGEKLEHTVFDWYLLDYQEGDILVVNDIVGQVADLAEYIKIGTGGAACWSDCHIYADITGGPRYVNMMMTSVLQFLQYDGMRVEKMIYSDFQFNAKKNYVYDVRVVGDVYKLVAGADAFVNYGSAHAIEEYFGYDAETDTSAKEISDALRSVLRTMHDFSDAIQICQTSKIPDALLALNEALTRFSDMPQDSRSVDDRMLRQLIDTIFDGYSTILRQKDSRAEHYEAIIRWCVDKGLLQQAMTLGTEWLPVCMIERGIVYPVLELKHFAEAAVDKMHPGWMQNFIIRPEEYRNAIYTERKQEICLMLLRAIEQGEIPENPSPILIAVQGVYKSLPELQKERHRYDVERRFNGLPQNVQEIYRYVCDRIEEDHRQSGTWTVHRLVHDLNAKDRIRSKISKIENKNKLMMKLLGVENLDTREPASDDLKGKWAARQDTWKKMTNVMRIVRTDCGMEHMLRCIRAHYDLREHRNQINHATEKNVQSRKEVIALIEECFNAIDAAATAMQQGKE